jgi:RNA polymerase sigma factor (TIGR02999 family)
VARSVGAFRLIIVTVFTLIYDELLRLAQTHLQRETGARALSPTALLHEAYMRLIDSSRVRSARRAEFMAIAATAMRRILVDHARGARTVERGRSLQHASIDSGEWTIEDRAALLLAVDRALDRLERREGLQAKVAECRFFGGMTEEETADALGIGVRTAKRDWVKAKVWLHNELAGVG